LSGVIRISFVPAANLRDSGFTHVSHQSIVLDAIAYFRKKLTVTVGMELANKQRTCYCHGMALRTCRVSCTDLNRIEHSVEVTAETLYEAIARGLAAFRNTEWAGEIGHGQTAITVVVKRPQVEHKVRMRDFEAWLQSNGRSPAQDDS
jgi:hypothetical protein